MQILLNINHKEGLISKKTRSISLKIVFASVAFVFALDSRVKWKSDPEMLCDACRIEQPICRLYASIWQSSDVIRQPLCVWQFPDALKCDGKLRKHEKTKEKIKTAWGSNPSLPRTRGKQFPLEHSVTGEFGKVK